MLRSIFESKSLVNMNIIIIMSNIKLLITYIQSLQNIRMHFATWIYLPTGNLSDKVRCIPMCDPHGGNRGKVKEVKCTGNPMPWWYRQHYHDEGVPPIPDTFTYCLRQHVPCSPCHHSTQLCDLSRHAILPHPSHAHCIGLLDIIYTTPQQGSCIAFHHQER